MHRYIHTQIDWKKQLFPTLARQLINLEGMVGLEIHNISPQEKPEQPQAKKKKKGISKRVFGESWQNLNTDYGLNNSIRSMLSFMLFKITRW